MKSFKRHVCLSVMLLLGGEHANQSAMQQHQHYCSERAAAGPVDRSERRRWCRRQSHQQFAIQHNNPLVTSYASTRKPSSSSSSSSSSYSLSKDSRARAGLNMNFKFFILKTWKDNLGLFCHKKAALRLLYEFFCSVRDIKVACDIKDMYKVPWGTCHASVLLDHWRVMVLIGLSDFS